MENVTENKTWVVWFTQNRYNSMVECKQFKSKESALEYYNSMNR